METSFLSVWRVYKVNIIIKASTNRSPSPTTLDARFCNSPYGSVVGGAVRVTFGNQHGGDITMFIGR